MIQVAIVDDLPGDAQRLLQFLTDYCASQGQTWQVDCFPSGESFLQAAGQGNYTLVFLDILMEGMDGMETAKRFRQVDPEALLVFVTTESAYAVEGYEVEASGFLVKSNPPDEQSFFRLMDRLEPKLGLGEQVDLTDTHLKTRLPAEALLYIDVTDHDLTLHTATKSYVLRMTLAKLKKRLPQDDRFFECHRGVLVNLDWVVSLETLVVTMKNGDVLPVSRRKHRVLEEKLAHRAFHKLRDQFR